MTIAAAAAAQTQQTQSPWPASLTTQPLVLDSGHHLALRTAVAARVSGGDEKFPIRKNLFEKFSLREGFKKKLGKSMVFCQTGGEGGSERVMKNQTAFLKKVFFREYLESF